LLHPRSRGKRRWDWLVVAVVGVTILSTPMHVGLYDSCDAGKPASPPDGYLPLLESCLASDPLYNATALLSNSSAAPAFEGQFMMRPHCSPSFIDGLRWALDAIFFVDMLLKFVTALPVERSLDMKCAASRLTRRCSACTLTHPSRAATTYLP